jgi:drug/metabolite transporter (DMT)-like permease
MLVALIPFVFWAVGDLIAVFVVRRIGGYVSNYTSFVLAVIGLTFLLPRHLQDFDSYTPLLLVANIIIGTIFLFGNQFYARALEKSNASLTNVVAGSFPVITLLIAFALGERISAVQGVGVALALSGVIVATINVNDLKSGISLRDPALRYAFFAMFCWGTYYALIKPIAESVGWFAASYVTFLAFPLVYLSLWVRQVGVIKTLRSAGWPILFILLAATLLVRGGEIVFNSALENNLSSLGTPLAGSSPVLFVRRAAFFVREKIQPLQWVGVVLGLTGIVVLAISGS